MKATTVTKHTLSLCNTIYTIYIPSTSSRLPWNMCAHFTAEKKVKLQLRTQWMSGWKDEWENEWMVEWNELDLLKTHQFEFNQMKIIYVLLNWKIKFCLFTHFSLCLAKRTERIFCHFVSAYTIYTVLTAILICFAYEIRSWCSTFEISHVSRLKRKLNMIIKLGQHILDI